MIYFLIPKKVKFNVKIVILYEVLKKEDFLRAGLLRLENNYIYYDIWNTKIWKKEKGVSKRKNKRIWMK